MKVEENNVSGSFNEQKKEVNTKKFVKVGSNTPSDMEWGDGVNQETFACPSNVSDCLSYKSNVSNELKENTDFDQESKNNTYNIPINIKPEVKYSTDGTGPRYECAGECTRNNDWKTTEGKDPKTEGGGNGFIIRIKNVKYKSGTRNVCTNNGKIVGIPGKFGMDSSCRFGG